MNENMKKIVELSDCEWIQKKWELKAGDWVFHIPLKEITFVNFVDCNGKFTVHPTFDLSFRSNKNDFYWLPIGLNPETGNWQIDDILMGILKVDYCDDVRSDYAKWLEDKHTTFLEPDIPILYAEDFSRNSDIILKLEWLREIIEFYDQKNEEKS